MEQSRIIEIKEDILSSNTNAADAFRAMLAQEGTFYTDIMASPGAGKTTLLLALLPYLRKQGEVGIIEADLASTVDSQKIKDAGVDAVQLETHGICHVDMNWLKSPGRPLETNITTSSFWRTSATWFAPQNSTPAHIGVSCFFRCQRATIRFTSTHLCSRWWMR